VEALQKDRYRVVWIAKERRLIRFEIETKSSLSTCKRREA
jgi:hypothetical protein